MRRYGWTRRAVWAWILVLGALFALVARCWELGADVSDLRLRIEEIELGRAETAVAREVVAPTLTEWGGGTMVADVPETAMSRCTFCWGVCP